MAVPTPFTLDLARNPNDAELIIKFVGLRNEDDQLWEIRSPVWLWNYRGQTDGPWTVPRREEIAEEFQSMLSTTPSAQIHMTLNGFGTRLWSATPIWFREAYWELRRRMGTRRRRPRLQIFTRDTLIPWEYMRPSQGSRVTKLLLLEHPVARRIVPRAGDGGAGACTIPAIAKGAFAVAAPEYDGSRAGALPRRSEAVRLIRDQYKGIQIDGTLQALLDTLNDGLSRPIAALYYYGHGAARHDRPGEARLIMQDTDLTVTAAAGNGLALGERYHSLCILTACETAATGSSLGTGVGWPALLLEKQFGGVLAPLWQIDPSQAFDFIKALLFLAVGKKVSIADALFAVRSRFAERAPSALSLLYFGDVHTILASNEVASND